MALYTRFEIYIPVVYTTKEHDAESSQIRDVTHALPHNLLNQFIEEVGGKYQGITQANPLAPALYKGWWKKNPADQFVIDYLTYLFGLVRIDQTDEAVVFFSAWKE